MYPDISSKRYWSTFGFTYKQATGKYQLVTFHNKSNLYGYCLACDNPLENNVFCNGCKLPHPLDWTTGNKSLDSFMQESWEPVKHYTDSYLTWIEYAQLSNIKEGQSLEHGCSHLAHWTETLPHGTRLRKLKLKKIDNCTDSQTFDFNKVIVLMIE